LRTLALLAAAALAFSAWSQDKPPKKKPAAAKQVVHKKPTPQQVRKFDDLEKKRETKKPERARERK
jgi:hypothetical protein